MAWEQWEWEHGGNPNVSVFSANNGGWIWLGISQCLPFLLLFEHPFPPFAYTAVLSIKIKEHMLIWGWWDNFDNEQGKWIIGGLKSDGHGNMQESISSPLPCLELSVKILFWAFLMPTILWWSFLFLLVRTTFKGGIVSLTWLMVYLFLWDLLAHYKTNIIYI